jgi:hypothetical protein
MVFLGKIEKSGIKPLPISKVSSGKGSISSFKSNCFIS